jgi:hypothetical protein
MAQSCYRCDRYFETNTELDDKGNWICRDCLKDIALVQGYTFVNPETDEELKARVERKRYWENKKQMH